MTVSSSHEVWSGDCHLTRHARPDAHPQWILSAPHAWAWHPHHPRPQSHHPWHGESRHPRAHAEAGRHAHAGHHLIRQALLHLLGGTGGCPLLLWAPVAVLTVPLPLLIPHLGAGGHV